MLHWSVRVLSVLKTKQCARTYRLTPRELHLLQCTMLEYLQDAVPLVENDYARVHDALPFGKIHRVRTQNRKGEKGTCCYYY